MKEKDTAERREHADSWANETLPMGIRRELLDRQIRRFAASGRQSQSHGGEGPANERGGERPQDS